MARCIISSCWHFVQKVIPDIFSLNFIITVKKNYQEVIQGEGPRQESSHKHKGDTHQNREHMGSGATHKKGAYSTC